MCMCVWNSTCIQYVVRVERFLVRFASFIHVLVYLTLERQTGTSISYIREAILHLRCSRAYALLRPCAQNKMCVFMFCMCVFVCV